MATACPICSKRTCKGRTQGAQACENKAQKKWCSKCKSTHAGPCGPGKVTKRSGGGRDRSDELSSSSETIWPWQKKKKG